MRRNLTSIGLITIVLLAGSFRVRAAEPAAVPKTGEIDLVFRQRSPLSAPKEIARRLSLKDADVAPDYDLSTKPFKVYIPKNYDPAVPVGVFVYLGYKDSVSVATPWEDLLDQSHLIFITSVAHHGEQYPNPIPMWQALGLAFDAVENLKAQYNIDAQRLYLMSWNKGSLQISLAAADVFSGFILTYDGGDYFAKLALPDGRSYPPTTPPPLAPQLQAARHRAFFLIDKKAELTDPTKRPFLRLAAMKTIGFDNVRADEFTIDGDLHFPNFKVEWFRDTVLPFFDKVAMSAPVKPPVMSATPAAPPATRPAPAAGRSTAAPVSEAQRQLDLAKLYINNKQTALAREKLQALIRNYPTDPAAATAKELLSKLPQQ